MAEVAMGRAARVYENFWQELIGFVPLSPDRDQTKSLSFILPRHSFWLRMSNGPKGLLVMQLKPQEKLRPSDGVLVDSQITKPDPAADTIHLDIQRGAWFDSRKDAPVLRTLGLGQLFVDWPNGPHGHDPLLIESALTGLTGRLAKMAIDDIVPPQL